LLSGTTLLQLWIAAGALLAELFGLALPTRSGAALTGAALTSSALPTLSGSTLLSGPALLATRALLAKLLRLALLTLTTLALTALAWAALANTTRPSVARSGATLATLLELFAALARSAELLRLSLLPTLLATLTTLATLLLTSRARSSWTAWSFVGRLAALLGLPLWLTFVLLLALVLVLGVFALRDDQAAVCSAGGVKRETQLRNRNRRHEGAGEQDVAKLLQLPDRFEWQVALPENR
jgi:hypothetical protein